MEPPMPDLYVTVRFEIPDGVPPTIERRVRRLVERAGGTVLTVQFWEPGKPPTVDPRLILPPRREARGL